MASSDGVEHLLGNLDMSVRRKLHEPGTDDGWHGIIEEGGEFAPEADRYHLYIGLFCPFAHRVNLVRHIKGLTDIIDMSIVRSHPKRQDGWSFPYPGYEYEGSTPDKLFGSKTLSEVYFRSDRNYKGRFSVPLLWDRKTGQAVNNESAEMLRTLPRAFNKLVPKEYADIDLCPVELQAWIETIARWVARDLNMGVYKVGFAKDQETYNKNIIPVYGALNKLEEVVHYNRGPYILGKEFTELDIQVYATLIRFDVAYVQLFKLNLGMIRYDYPNLNNWMKNLYWNVRGFKETTDFRHIKEGYTKSMTDINPNQITPMGPDPDIERGFEPDFSKLRIGSVDLPAVLQHQMTLAS